MKTGHTDSIYAGATSWQERRAREKHQLAMQQAAAPTQQGVADELAKISAKLDDMVEILRRWDLEEHHSGSDVN